ncbi:unnamed protein product, partial [Discosporangium mesarthrocarpum]
VQVHASNTWAWVTCVEDMRSPVKAMPKTTQAVTNVFRKTGGRWRLLQHHASDMPMEGKDGPSS